MLLCFAAIFTRIHVKSKSVQGTQHSAGTAVQYMSVNHGGAYVAVAEKPLNRADVVA